jgi:hypothetical protein
VKNLGGKVESRNLIFWSGCQEEDVLSCCGTEKECESFKRRSSLVNICYFHPLQMIRHGSISFSNASGFMKAHKFFLTGSQYAPACPSCKDSLKMGVEQCEMTTDADGM